MSKIKSFTIQKELVVKAYELIKANGGATDADQQSLADKQACHESLFKSSYPKLELI